MEISKGATIGILGVVIVVVLLCGYYFLFKPHAQPGGSTREMYMKQFGSGGTSSAGAPGAPGANRPFGAGNGAQ
jgi:hypothetical protein